MAQNRYVQLTSNCVLDVEALVQYRHFKLKPIPAVLFSGGFDVEYIIILVPGAQHQREDKAQQFWVWLTSQAVSFSSLTGTGRQAAIDVKFATDGSVAERNALEAGG